MELVTIALCVVILVLVVQIFKAWQDSRKSPPEVAKLNIGDITLHSLVYHNGTDWSKPTCIAVKGTVYDVTKSNDIYGPGKLRHT